MSKWKSLSTPPEEEKVTTSSMSDEKKNDNNNSNCIRISRHTGGYEYGTVAIKSSAL